MGKFTLLYFVTAGFYSLYWFYRCWAGLEKQNGRRYLKVGRAAFAVLFVHDLFAQLDTVDRQRGDTYTWQPARLAWVFVGAAVAQFVLTYWVEYLQWGCWARLGVFVGALMAQFYALYQAQLIVNRIEQDPFGRRNQALNMQNHIWIIFGLYIWFTLFRGCLYPTAHPGHVNGVEPAGTTVQPSIDAI